MSTEKKSRKHPARKTSYASGSESKIKKTSDGINAPTSAKKTSPVRHKKTAKKKTTRTKRVKKTVEPTMNFFEARTTSLSQSRIEKYYTKIVTSFVVITVFLVIVIAYFSFSKTTITVIPTPVEQEVTIQTTLDALGGTVLLTDVEVTATAATDELSASTDAVTSSSGTAGGTVTIFNNYSKDQPLVSTTRLLSEDGVLFRTQETVTVPAGGSIEVNVLADEEGAEGDIGPSTFEIVALWDGLKDDIYATSETAMTGGLVETTVLSDTVYENTKLTVNEALRSEALERFEGEMATIETLPENPLLIDEGYISEIHTDEQNGTIGEEIAGEFTITRSATVAGAVVDSALLESTIAAEVQDAMPKDTVLNGKINLNTVNLELEELTTEEGESPVTVTLTIQYTITADHKVVSTAALRDKSEQELQTYLQAFDEIASVDVKFSPFWVSKTSSIADNITVEVQ